MKKNKTKISFVLAILFLSSFSLFAQEFGVGADMVSRYVWRGTDFGQSPSIQPTMSYTNGGFDVGFWGAYQLGRTNPSVLPADELDFYAGYSFDIGASSLGLLVTDYYFPNAGGRFGDLQDDGKGSHIVEVGASYTGPDSFPISFTTFVNVYNDPDNSSYFELGYSTAYKEVGIDLFAGASPGGDNQFYGNDKFAFVNVGISLSKEIKITDDFSLPIFGSYIINPNEDNVHFVFGVSL